MASPFQLTDFIVDKIVYETEPTDATSHEKEPLDFVIEVEARQVGKDKKSHVIALTLNINQGEALGKRSYSLIMRIRGHFTLSEEMDKERRLNFFLPLAVSNLYGIARGVVAQITGLGPNQRITLPTINIHQALKKPPQKISVKKKEKTFPQVTARVK